MLTLLALSCQIELKQCIYMFEHICFDVYGSSRKYTKYKQCLKNSVKGCKIKVQRECK